MRYHLPYRRTGAQIASSVAVRWEQFLPAVLGTRVAEAQALSERRAALPLPSLPVDPVAAVGSVPAPFALITEEMGSRNSVPAGLVTQ